MAEVAKPGEVQLLRQLVTLWSGVGAEAQAKPKGRWEPDFNGSAKQLASKAKHAQLLGNFALREGQSLAELLQQVPY